MRLYILALVLVGCGGAPGLVDDAGGSEKDSGHKVGAHPDAAPRDTGTEGGRDAGVQEAGPEAGVDAAPCTGSWSIVDGGWSCVPTPDAGVDAGPTDSSSAEGATDTGVDAGVDAGCALASERCTGANMQECVKGSWETVGTCPTMGCDATVYLPGAPGLVNLNGEYCTWVGDSGVGTEYTCSGGVWTPNGACVGQCAPAQTTCTAGVSPLLVTCDLVAGKYIWVAGSTPCP